MSWTFSASVRAAAARSLPREARSVPASRSVSAFAVEESASFAKIVGLTALASGS
jgi:hypothetical protein